MKPPLYQRAIKIVIYILGGFVALGSVLDSVANALSLITPLVAIIGTVCIMLCWLLVYIILPYHPIPSRGLLAIKKCWYENLVLSRRLLPSGWCSCCGYLRSLRDGNTRRRSNNKKTASAVPEKEIPKPQKRLTLYDLFKTDFPNFLKVDNVQEYTLESPVHKRYKVSANFNVYMDFDAKSKFIGAYLPSSPGTYTVALIMADKYKDVLDDIDSTVLVKGKYLADFGMTDSKSLIFSGRIYIYHEDDLTLEQLGYLDRLYRARNLSVQFRGPNYQEKRWLQESK